MLKKRIITAVCLFVVFVFSLFYLPAIWFAALVACVYLVSAWEWSGLSGFSPLYQRVIFCLLGVLIAIGLGRYVGLFSHSILDQSTVLSVFTGAGVWWAVALLWVQGYPSSAVLWGSRWIRAVMGLFVLIPSGLALVFLHEQPHGAWLILLMVLVVATADTGAYFSGRAFGRRKLAKDVSPGKSWEGVLGGLLGCTLLVLLVAWVAGLDSWWVLLMIVIPTALVSVLGDLLESMVKRHGGFKDSGVILPGHGGMLDRIDGLTAAAPIFALALLLSGWQLPL